MRQPEPNKIHVGLKFTSLDFAADGEIVAIREEVNEIDIKLTDTQGHAHIEKNWDLGNIKTMFKNGTFTPVDPKKEINISII